MRLSIEVGTQLTVGPNNPRTDEVNEEEFPVARWEHIAFTANGASLTMYRNGQAVSSSAYLGDISPGIIEGIALGVDVDDAGLPVDGEAYWDGRMDDLGIWGRPLSANEIASIYVNGLEGLDLTLRGGGITQGFPPPIPTPLPLLTQVLVVLWRTVSGTWTAGDGDGRTSGGGALAAAVLDVLAPLIIASCPQASAAVRKRPAAGAAMRKVSLRLEPSPPPAITSATLAIF